MLGGEGLPMGRYERRLDLEELQRQALWPVAILIACTGGVLAWLYLPGEHFRARQFLFGIAAMVGGVLSWRMSRRAAGLASLVLAVWTLLLSLLAAVAFGPAASALAGALAIVLAVPTMEPAAPAIAAILSLLCQVGLGASGVPRFPLGVLVVGYGLMGCVLSLAMGSLRRVLLWSWQRHEEARKLAEQLRDRQGELNRTLNSLDLAYRLLQRTSHELALARAEAEEARRFKEQFAANISHELRTPLNLILGFSELMHLSPDVYGDVNWTSALRRDIAHIYTASQHLLQLVDDVLDLSRLEAERMPLRREPVNLNALVEEAVATAKELARGRPLQIELELDPAIPWLSLDAGRVRQVMLNLLNNAIRFTRDGWVRVRTVKRGAEVFLTVEDRGPGIAAQDRERIFDEFYQASFGAGSGTGLGLAIAKRFVQMHGGRIWVESEPGKGSCFHVCLPAGARPAASRLRHSGPAPVLPRGQQENLLLVGEDEALRRLLERHLPGFGILRADSQEEVQRALEAEHPRALLRNLSPAQAKKLLEGVLPLELREGVPALVCALPSNSWRAELLGVAACLQKPVQPQELVSALRRFPGARSVLVVDDDRGFVQFVVRALESAEGRYQVRYAYSGQEALQELEQERPDVVLVDLLMPGMSGQEFLAQLRAREQLRELPVVVITAKDVEEELPEAAVTFIGLVQKGRPRLADSLDALAALLERAKPSYFSEAHEPQGPVAVPGG